LLFSLFNLFIINLKFMQKMNKYLVLLVTAGLLSGLAVSCKKEDPDAAKACFTFEGEISAGTPVTFNSSCSENAMGYTWNFGDGGTSAEANPTHTFTTTGDVTVTLTVEAENGSTDRATENITVLAPTVIEHSGNITEDETWIEGEHLITGELYVDGATLTIEPGAIVRFTQGNGMYFGYYSGNSGATLIANGTTEKPITFTSVASTKSPGDWDYIGFYDGASTLSSMDFCVVEYGGGYNENTGMVYVEESAVSITNSSLRFSESQGAVLNNSGYFTAFTGNTVQDNGGSALKVEASSAHTIGTGNDITSDKGIAVEGERMEIAEAVWLKHTTHYWLQGNLYIGSESGTSLTIDPGVEIRIGGGYGIFVGYYSGTFGTLNADGTESDPIVFTSAAPEMSRTPGDWDFIGFYDGAGSSSVMDHCLVSYGGGYSESRGMISLDGAGLSLTNSTVSNSQYYGVETRNDGMFTAFSGNTFDANGTYPVWIQGNFVHTLGSGNTYKSGKGILVNNDRIEHSEGTWLDQAVPYIIDGNLYLGSASGARLTIEPGTVVSFTEGSGFWIGYYSGTFGVLVADAEPGSEIVFTSSAPVGFESAGDWDGLIFDDGTSTGSILDNCIVRYAGGYSNSSGNITVRNDTPDIPVISNCTIEFSERWGIYLGNNASPMMSNNTFSNCAAGDVGN